MSNKKKAGQMNAFMSGTNSSSKEFHSLCFKHQQRICLKLALCYIFSPALQEC